MREFRTQEEIGEHLRALREEGGFSQGDIGQLLGVDQGAVSRIESGQRALAARELMLLTDSFRVSSDSILCREEAPVLLRAGETDSDGVQRSLDEFRECIEDYVGLESMIR